MSEWTNKRMDGWMDGQTDRQTDGRTDGQFHRKAFSSFYDEVVYR